MGNGMPCDCQLMCYTVTVGSHAVASVPPVSLGKLRWGNALSQKLKVGERRSPASYGTLTTGYIPVPKMTLVISQIG